MTKLMLVEDDNNLREIYGARLQAEGYEIVSAKDGEEALALAVKERPDLIISDVMMPKISGFDMLDILRSTTETKHTKVIMMTALSQKEDQERGEQLGADRYLVKSQVTLEDVVQAVSEVLNGDSAASTAEVPSVAPAPAEPVMPQPSAPAPEPVAPPAPVDPAPEPVMPPAPEPTPNPMPMPAPSMPEPPMPDPVPVAPAPPPIPEPPVPTFDPVPKVMAPTTSMEPNPPVTTQPTPVNPVVPAPAEPPMPQPSGPIQPVAVQTASVPVQQPPVAPVAQVPMPAANVPAAPPVAQPVQIQPAPQPVVAPVAMPQPAPVPEPVAQPAEVAQAPVQVQPAAPTQSAQPVAGTIVNPPATPPPATKPEPEENLAFTGPVPDDTNTEPRSSATISHGVKVIQPLSNAAPKTDINELLAREEAATQAPQVITPAADQTVPSTAPAQTNGNPLQSQAIPAASEQTEINDQIQSFIDTQTQAVENGFADPNAAPGGMQAANPGDISL